MPHDAAGPEWPGDSRLRAAADLREDPDLAQTGLGRRPWAWRDQCWLCGIRTTRPSRSSVTLIWQDRRELGSTFSAKSSIDSSIADWLPVLSTQAGST